MPPKPLVEFSRINIENTLFDQEEIKRCIPHRHEMLQLDRIIGFEPEEGLAVGIKEVRDDEFWVRGHIPGRPILPGVLLIEAAAQLCSFHFWKTITLDHANFFGLAKLDRIKYRGSVEPGDMVVFMVKQTNIRRRAAAYTAQAFVDGVLIFEADLMGAVV